MTESNKKYHSFAPSFYDKYIQDDENMQAKINPILNQIQENRVTVKELHSHFGVRFSEMMTSYRNRLEELKDHYEKKISEMQLRQNALLNQCKEALEDLKKTKS